MAIQVIATLEPPKRLMLLVKISRARIKHTPNTDRQ